jgi:lambda family phage minor tail protein L
MTISQDIQKNAVPVFVELFEIDFSSTNIPELAGSIMRITNGSTALFGGETYSPFPVHISGISQSSEGAPPRPSISIANVNKYIGAMAFQYGDIIGSTVTYIRTFEPYLNQVSRISLPPLRYYIAKKTVHDKTVLSFELRDFRDKERAYMPKRQMLKKDFPGLGINKNVR